MGVSQLWDLLRWSLLQVHMKHHIRIVKSQAGTQIMANCTKGLLEACSLGEHMAKQPLNGEGKKKRSVSLAQHGQFKITLHPMGSIQIVLSTFSQNPQLTK